MGSFFYVKNIFEKNFINLVYKMLFSVLIYGEVEQNIDFNSYFNLMFLSNLFCLAVKFLHNPEKYTPEISIL